MDKFYIKKLDSDTYAVMKYYEEDAHHEQWRICDTYEDAVELCHYCNGGSIKDYMNGKYLVYEWRLARA